MHAGGFPGGKSSRGVWLTTLPPSCAVVMKSGNFNFLELIWYYILSEDTKLHLFGQQFDKSLFCNIAIK